MLCVAGYWAINHDFFPDLFRITGLTAPLEDPNEPSYMLGHAPTMRNHDDETEGNVAVPNNSALANRLELARGAGHRYLNMHWGDGSVCDKTGRKREVEVQVCTFNRPGQ